MLHLDYETRSRVDLLKQGAYIYAQDESTQVICLGWAVDDGPVTVWDGLSDDNLPDEVLDAFAAGEERSLHAHNAQFERLITKYVLCRDYNAGKRPRLVAEPPLEAWYCTATQARARALPGGLEDLGRALDAKLKKDHRGRQLIRLLCIPQSNGSFSSRRGLLEEMRRYCERDVEVERACAGATVALTDDEWQDYLLSERVNDRGIYTDRELAISARNYAREEFAEISEKLFKMTRGKINTPRQFQKSKEWVLERAPEVEPIMVRYKNGVRKLSMDAAARHNILAMDLPDEVRQFLLLVDSAGKTSVSKFEAMDLRASEDDNRVRGAYIFCGAGQTGRFSSHGLQVHNFSRSVASDPVAMKRAIQGRTILHGEVMTALASMLRPAIMAPKSRVLVGGDASSIEARFLPWLAGGEDVLDIYRSVDADPELPDPYMHAAADIFGIAAEDVTPAQRQVGKVAVLSLGYQGGYRAFQAMARNYGLQVSETEAERIKGAWRRRNRWCVRYWEAVEKTAKKAVRNPETYFAVGKVRYMMGKRDLWCKLPDGAVLSYPYAEIKDGDLVAMKASWKPAADDPEWPRENLYGGLLTANQTQAVAARFLKHVMRQVPDDLVATTHDEVILEVPVKRKAAAQEAVRVALTTPPAWAADMPLACDTWIGTRYRK